MVIGNSDAANATGGANNMAHPSGIPQEKIDNIMSGIANTGDVKMNNHRKKLRQRFDIIKKLGQGTYGKVQLGINKETGQEVAIKTIKKCKIEAEADLVRIRREVQIMSSVQHPNIIHIYEVFENREKMVLVMEFAAGGELYDYLSERKVLSEEEARRIFRQVATAVYYCHKHKICHRDLKLENILLDDQGNAKIADFGLSNVFDDQRLLATFCGSPLYASPEIVEGTPYQGPEVDCWSLGVLLYTLVYGSMPFDGSNFKRLVKQISEGDYYEPKKPSRASSLIREMLTVCPRKRATIEQICSHWWVNENDNRSCLDLAEDLANRTPVRLDVLLSLTPAAITADQLVVPSADGSAAGKGSERVPRSHSVGSIREMGANTEAERRILDMVAAGGEAALMPSPTRTITPAQSPVQSKRKLENTVSTENAAGLVKKKEKAGSSALVIDEAIIDEEKEEALESIPMETDETATEESALSAKKSTTFSQLDMQNVGDMCTHLIQDNNSRNVPKEQNSTIVEPTAAAVLPRQKTISKLDSVEEAPEEKDATKVIKKFVNKHKTADLVNAIGQATPEQNNASATEQTSSKTTPASNSTAPIAATTPQFVRKCSLQDEAPLNKFNDRRKSRILETAEKFQQMNASNGAEKPKKFVLPGVSVGSYKKEFERKATEPAAPPQGPTAGELRAMEQVAAAAAAEETAPMAGTNSPSATLSQSNSIEGSDSKNSMTNFSLDEARRSMENSIALLRQAQHESSKEVDQLCAKTESIGMHDEDPMERERERKLKNARAIIGNAIQPASPGGDPNPGTVKTSTAQITLKSATLPRRKTAKTEIQLDIKPRIVEQSPMRFTTEMQHPVADLRSAPAREGPIPFSPVTTGFNTRATSLEPKEHIIPIQRPQMVYTRTGSNTTTKSGGSLSRQSTLDSESDTTTNTNMSQSTVTGSSQPIKKSPREFIIPIAVEGGGFITPREGSIEPSESSHTTSSRSTFSRMRPTRRIGSLLNDSGVDEGLPFHKMRTASINRDADDDSRFTLHKLRSSRPVKKISQDNDESQSSGEEDDDDGFEILTAENLFSTLLQRVRALTNRLNVNNDITSGFPNSSRLLNNLRQGQSSFWNQEPFGSRLNNTSGTGSNLGAPWRHSMSRDLGSDMDSMFSRTGATLPRGNKSTTKRQTSDGFKRNISDTADSTDNANKNEELFDEPLDLADLDLSRLRLSKKDLETLSSITPGLPKCFQEQLLAKLPPTQARKLSRTLSMQNSPQTAAVRVHKRSQSGGRDLSQEDATSNDIKENIADECTSSEGTKTTSITKTTTHSSTTTTVANKKSDENSDRSSSLIYRRSLSRTRYDYDSVPTSTETAANSRSNSICRDDYGKSLCSSYSSDISDKYKYYSPYLSKSAKETSTDSGSVSPLKRYGSVSPRESSHSPNVASAAGGTLGRPPSGVLSPPPVPADSGNSSLRRRSSQRRISRFLRPDFFEEPVDESAYQREKKMRERETQSVLREIREKSRESSRDRLSQSSYDCDELLRRKHSLPSEENVVSKDSSLRHVRNKSMEMHFDGQSNKDSSCADAGKRHRRSLSRTRNQCEEMDKSQLADKILEELQILSAVKSQQEKRLSAPREVLVELSLTSSAKVLDQTAQVEVNSDDYKEKTATIRKVKKLKPKEKSTEATAEAETKATAVVIKKVKKIVKKTESTKAVLPAEELLKSPIVDSEKPKPESKLKRPKSYPTKEPAPTTVVKSEATVATPPSKLPTKASSSTLDGGTDLNNTLNKSTVTTVPITVEPRENRLVRPKSYPASKLTPPKDTKKTTRSGIAIPSSAEQSNLSMVKSSSITRQSTTEEKSTTVTPTGKSSIDTSSCSESRPTSVKKITTIKVTKKSKLAQPTAVTTPLSTTEDLSPLTLAKQLKEKSPEKKVGKGLLYAIGQKFEKLRDSAMSKDKRSTSSTSSSSTTNASAKRSSPDRSSPEQIKVKTKIIKKKKSTEVTTVNNDPTAATPNLCNDVTATENTVEQAKPIKSDKRSRIDAMIRSLRERSIPRIQPLATESHYITRAVSVEEMPGTFNRNAVNKVLGLFKRFEKDGNERKVRSTRSTSNIERHMHGSPPSPIYQNAKQRPRSGGSIAAPKAEITTKPAGQVLTISKSAKDCGSMCDCKAALPSIQDSKITCTDCLQAQAACALIKRHDEPKTTDHMTQPPAQEQSLANREKRKALMLDLVKLEKLDNSSSICSRSKAYTNGNGIYSNLPPYPGAQNTTYNENITNNNNNNNNCTTNNNNQVSTNKYRTSSAHEINRNHMFTPSSENIANYSSDSRSYQDDCASTSTFMSPSDEPELYFDNWSVCSEDNYMLATPSPTVSRLSRVSQFSSPSRAGDVSDPNESVIDRIKRRSFYCRFNDKKPKRTSSIVGPTAVRDYYREQQAAVKSRAANSNVNSNSNKPNVTSSKERAPSPDITQQFFRPLKLSPVGTELKPPIYKAPHDFTSSTMSKPRKSLNDIRPTTSPSFHFKRYGTSAMNSNDNDYLSLTSSAVPSRIKTSSGSSSYDSNGGYYTTYNPKRRSSYNLNGVLPNSSNVSSSHHIDGYATVGRRTTRPYDQRTMSLLEPPSTSSSSFRREPRTPLRDYTSSISRSNSHYRTPTSSTRSPTNI